MNSRRLRLTGIFQDTRAFLRENQELAAGFGDAAGPDGADPLVLLMKNADTGIPCRVFITDSRRPVRGTVVDQKDLQVAVSLR